MNYLYGSTCIFTHNSDKMLEHRISHAGSLFGQNVSYQWDKMMEIPNYYIHYYAHSANDLRNVLFCC